MATDNHRRRQFFISYSRGDNLRYIKSKEGREEETDYLAEVESFLKSEFNSLIWTSNNISLSRNWTKVIDSALQDSTDFVLIWTPRAAISPYVKYEIASAIVLGLRLFIISPPQHLDFDFKDASGFPESFNQIQRGRDVLVNPIEKMRFKSAIAEGGQRLEDLEPQIESAMAILRRVWAEGKDQKGWGNTTLQLWQDVIRELKTWALENPEVNEDTLEIIYFVLQYGTIPEDKEDKRLLLEEVAFDFKKWVANPRLRKDALEFKRYLDELRVELIELSQTLLAQNVPAAEIQKRIHGSFKPYCRSKFNQDKMPPEKQVQLGMVRFTPDIKRACGLCKVDDATTDEHGCCRNCGLFYTFWDEKEINAFLEKRAANPDNHGNK